jgi:hypothetical protein
VTGVPFVVACLVIGVTLAWAGAMIFWRSPGWVAVAVDVTLVYVVPYVPPFKRAGVTLTSCGSLFSSCDPSWTAVAGKVLAVPQHAWIGGAACLAVPVLTCYLVAAGRAERLARGREW